MKLISILFFSCIFISTIQAQGSFVCQLEERPENGIYAKSGMRLSYSYTGKKKPYVVERTQDTLFVLKDTLGNIIKDKLRNFITKISGLVVFENYKGKWGVLRKDMSTLIEAKYDDLTFEAVGNGFNCLVKKNKRWGMIDSTNKKILPIKYNRLQLLNTHLAFLEKNRKKYLFFLEDRTKANIEGFCVKGISTKNTQRQFLITKNDLIGVMDNNGKIIIKPEFDRIQYMELDKEGLLYYYIVNKNRKRGAIDKKGNLLVPLMYDWVTIKNKPKSINDAVFSVRMNNKNTEHLYYKGEVLNLKVQNISFKHNPEGTNIIFKSQDKFGLFDYASNKVKIEPIYERFRQFNDSLYFASKEGKFGIISADNQERLAFKYDHAPQYLKKSEFYPNNYFKVMKNGLVGYLDENYQVLLNPEYQILRAFSEGLARVKKDEKWGYINEAFKEQITLRFDHAEAFKNGEAKVKLNGKEFFINKKGECVRDCE